MVSLPRATLHRDWNAGYAPLACLESRLWQWPCAVARGVWITESRCSLGDGRGPADGCRARHIRAVTGVSPGGRRTGPSPMSYLVDERDRSQNGCSVSILGHTTMDGSPSPVKLPPNSERDPCGPHRRASNKQPSISKMHQGSREKFYKRISSPRPAKTGASLWSFAIP